MSEEPGHLRPPPQAYEARQLQTRLAAFPEQLRDSLLRLLLFYGLGSAADDAVAACDAAIQQLATLGDVNSQHHLEALLAIPMSAMNPAVAHAFLDHPPPPGASKPGLAARPLPLDDDCGGGAAAGAVVWLMLQVCRGAGSATPARSASAYRLLSQALCSSLACAQHLVQLPEVHTMIATHIDTWLHLGGRASTGLITKQARNAVALAAALPIAAAPAPGCCLSQHMERLVDAMRPCLRTSPLVDTVDAISAVAHLATLFPEEAIRCGAGAAVLRDLLYEGHTNLASTNIAGTRPAALRVLVAELAHAGGHGDADPVLLPALQRRLVGHPLFPAETVCGVRPGWTAAGGGCDVLVLALCTGQPSAMVCPAVDVFVRGCASWRAAHDRGDSLAATALVALGDIAGFMLRQCPEPTHALLWERGFGNAAAAAARESADHTEETNSGRAGARVGAERLVQAQQSLTLLEEAAARSRGRQDEGGSAAGTLLDMHGSCTPTACAREGCSAVGVMSKLCPHCRRGYHSDACRSADAVSRGHAACALSPILLAMSEATMDLEEEDFRVLCRAQFSPLARLLRLDGNPHAGRTAEAVAALLDGCSSVNQSVPAELWSAAVAFWKRTAAAAAAGGAQDVLKDDAAMLALHSACSLDGRVSHKG